MFNHHFFEGQVGQLRPRSAAGSRVSGAVSLQASAELLQTFLSEREGGRAVLVADPPFGGLVKPLANSFSLISQVWRSQNPGQSPLVSSRPPCPPGPPLPLTSSRIKVGGASVSCGC